MRVLVACEFSGVVRDAFLARGHAAVSCDLLPTEAPGPHIQGDVLDYLDDGWDLMIAHPPCTYLANSGVRWLYDANKKFDPKRYSRMQRAVKFFTKLLDANIPRIAIENPIMHKYARTLIKSSYTQIIQPWQFGHKETKATCLWLKGLRPLKEGQLKLTRYSKVHRMIPSPDRAKLRSITPRGIAKAMANQWGSRK